MPYIVYRQYITEDQLLAHELAGLAECASVMPWDIVASIASNLIGTRHDRQEWIGRFQEKVRRVLPATPTDNEGGG